MWAHLGVAVFSTLISACISSDLRLEPQDLNLVLGENLCINCIIKQPLRNRYNASNLAFRFYLPDPPSVSSSREVLPSKEDKDCDHLDEAVSDETDFYDDLVYNTTNEIPSDCSEDLDRFEEPSGSFEKVDPSYIEIINRYRVRLKFPHVRKRLDEGSLTCYIDKQDDVPQNVCKTAHILVGERPHVPFVTTSKVNNWKTFEFHWETLKKNKVYKTTYKAWYKWSSSTDFIECPPPPPKKCAQSCVVDVNLSASTVIFKVNTSNLVGAATSSEKVVNLSDIVTPDPVPDVKVTVVNSSACVKFKSPKFGMEMEYEANFICAEQPYITIFPRSNDNVLEECVSGLPSYSNCSLSIRAKPYSYGLWGEFSSRELFTMPQQVPLEAPEVCRSCFELLSTDDGKTCSVRIFPKPLPLAVARGRVVKYRVSLSMPNHRRTSVNESIFSADIAGLDFSGLDLKSSYSIAVVAATDAGYNESIVATPLTLGLSTAKTLRSWPRNITAFILNGTTVRLSWVCKRPKLSGFTVFWCRVVNLNQCKDPLLWNRVLSNVTRFDITNLPASDLVNYLFGVAVETVDGYSSGVVWTKCLYNISRVSSPPQIDKKVNGTKVQLNFSKDECYGGFPYAYRVIYCPLSEDNKIRPGSAKELIVDNDTCEVDHLALDTKYLFVVSSLSVAGPSLMNSSFHLSIPGASGSSHVTRIGGAVFGGIVLCLLTVWLVHYRKKIKTCMNIRITTPDVVQHFPNSSGDSEPSPDYAQMTEDLPRTTYNIHENSSALSNEWNSNLDSSLDHLIPETPNGVQEPPFRGRSATDDEDDNTYIASDNEPDLYTRGKLSDKPDVVPSSPPVEPSFQLDDSTLVLPHSIALDLGDGGNELHDLPEPEPLVDAIDGSGSPGNESNMSSCGYAVGRLGDHRSGPSLSSADGVSIQMHESGIDKDAGNGHLLQRPFVIALDDEAENSNNARSGHPQSRPSVLGDLPMGSISGSSDDVPSDLVQQYSSAVVLPEDCGGDDDYSDSVLSSSDYAFANFKNKEYDPLLDTPAADVVYSDSDGDSDKYAAVSFVDDKQTVASNDSSPQAPNIPLLLISASDP